MTVTNQIDWLDKRKEWKGLTSLIEVKSIGIIKGKKSEGKKNTI